jgi:hypothetical protein
LQGHLIIPLCIGLTFSFSSFQYDSRMWTVEEVAIADCLQGIGPGDIVP